MKNRFLFNAITLFYIFFIFLLSGCSHKIQKIDFKDQKYQAEQNHSVNEAKNYDLCKHCIHYTNFSKNT